MNNIEEVGNKEVYKRYGEREGKEEDSMHVTYTSRQSTTGSPGNQG